MNKDEVLNVLRERRLDINLLATKAGITIKELLDFKYGKSDLPKKVINKISKELEEGGHL